MMDITTEVRSGVLFSPHVYCFNHPLFPHSHPLLYCGNPQHVPHICDFVTLKNVK